MITKISWRKYSPNFLQAIPDVGESAHQLPPYYLMANLEVIEHFLPYFSIAYLT